MPGSRSVQYDTLCHDDLRHLNRTRKAKIYTLQLTLLYEPRKRDKNVAEVDRVGGKWRGPWLNMVRRIDQSQRAYWVIDNCHVHWAEEFTKMVLRPVSPVYIIWHKIAQNRHEEPMNTPRCEVTNLWQIRASSRPTLELNIRLVCGQKSKHSEDEDLDFLQEAQVLNIEPTIRRNHRADMQPVPTRKLGKLLGLDTLCWHNFEHNGIVRASCIMPA